MDRNDEQILDLMKGNARISFQELGEALGMSRVAAKKRVKKLEEAGIIRGYNTTIYRDDEVTVLIDITTVEGSFEKVLEYVSTRTAFVRQIFCTTSLTGLFAIIIHPTTFYCSFLCLDMLTQYLLLAKIIHIIAG